MNYWQIKEILRTADHCLWITKSIKKHDRLQYFLKKDLVIQTKKSLLQKEKFFSLYTTVQHMVTYLH